MNIMIAGCGKIGSTITESLVSEGHSVAIVDNDPAVVSETRRSLCECDFVFCRWRGHAGCIGRFCRICRIGSFRYTV